MRFCDLFLVSSLLVLGVFGFDITRYDNVGVYWGQNAQGANNPNDTTDYQKRLGFYCKDNSADIVSIAFLDKCFSTGGLPEINLANICNNKLNDTFPGTSLADCQRLAADIEYCQGKGSLVTLSIGGASANASLTGDSEAEEFAEMIWDLFLGGWSDTRPFGSAVLDGVDLDIENGSSTGYAAFVNKIRSLAVGADKEYYITAAPQCPFPDPRAGAALNSTWFDAVFVQFYNNYCGLQNFNGTFSSNWNFGLWDYWARNISPNKDIKVYIAALGGNGTTGSEGYVPAATLSTIALQMRQNYPSFGGVVLWDASQAYVNERYARYMKKALTLAGGVGFTYPPCSAYGYVDGETYVAGQRVSYDGYIWEAKWWTNAEPTHDTLGSWMEVSACQGMPPAEPSSSPMPSPTPTPSPSPSVMPGSPLVGSLDNSGGKGAFERVYFRNVELSMMLQGILVIVCCLSAPVAFGVLF